MKKLFSFLLFMSLCTELLSQELVKDAAYYHTKSKKQRSGAWVLLGLGSALVVGGLLIGNRDESSFSDAATGGIMGIAGGAGMVGSIPLFIASSRNRRKALSLTFKNEPSPKGHQTITLNNRFGLTLTLKIAFN
jgi:hypothetical protein